MKAYPNNWQEIYSRSMLRVMGNIPLKRAEIAWQKLYNVDSIVPNLKSQYLSRIMQDIGSNRESQRIIFTSPLYVAEFNINLRIRNNGCNDACRRNGHQITDQCMEEDQ